MLNVPLLLVFCAVIRLLPLATLEYAAVLSSVWESRHKLSASPVYFAQQNCKDQAENHNKLVSCRIQVSGRHRGEIMSLCDTEKSEIKRVKRYYKIKVDCEVDLAIIKVKLEPLNFQTKA